MTDQTPLVLPSPEIVRDGQRVEMRFELELGGSRQSVFFRFPTLEVDLQHHGEAMISVAMYLAMAEGRPIRSEVPADPVFIENVCRLQPHFSRWMPAHRPIPIEAPARELHGPQCTPDWKPSTRGAAVMFSGGVDSFHSALEIGTEATVAIYIHGFDTELGDVGYRGKISRELRRACDSLGLDLIEVETNLRDVSDEYCEWVNYHGAMISAVAHLLSARFERVYIPASYTYEHCDDCGTQPLYDPLWSSRDLQFVHHGADTARFDKVAALSKVESARRHLRVCWENIDEAYNCGRCEKCIRTYLNLRILGAEAAFSDLFGHHPEVAEIIPHICVPSPHPLEFFGELVDGAERHGADGALLSELHRVLAEVSSYHLTKEIARLSASDGGDYFGSDEWRARLLPRLRQQLLEDHLLEDPEWLVSKLALDKQALFELLWEDDHRGLISAVKDREARA